jgi:hypothetical protein
MKSGALVDLEAHAVGTGMEAGAMQPHPELCFAGVCQVLGSEEKSGAHFSLLPSPHPAQ